MFMPIISKRISNIYQFNSEIKKFFILINYHLYILTKNSTNPNIITEMKNIYYIIANQYLYPFNILIDKDKLIINLISYEEDDFLDTIYCIKSFIYENYNSVASNIPQIKQYCSYSTIYYTKCQYDKHNSLIKCIYEDSSYIKFLVINSNNEYINDIYIESKSNLNINELVFTFSNNTDFICFKKDQKINCCHKKNSDTSFAIKSIPLSDGCSDLQIHHFEEKNDFLVACKRTSENSYDLFLYENSNFSSITYMLREFDNPDIKHFVIYNALTNKYQLISENDFEIKCKGEKNQSTDIIILSTNKIQENIETTNNHIYNYTNKEKFHTSYNNFTDNALLSNIHSYINTNNIINNTNYSRLISESIENFQEKIIKGDINISKIKEGKDFISYNEGLLISFTTTENQNEKENNYETTINLGKCESKLKDFYKIKNESTLYILKIEIEQKWINIPKIEYEVYYPFNSTKMEKLNLSICENTKIEISIPLNISEESIEQFNPKSNYYNDICSKKTTENGTDMILKDRRNEFLENNVTLCEDNCEFVKYDSNSKKAKCECQVKTILSFVDEIKIDKNNLMKNFVDINNIANIQIIKCYKIIFNKENLFKNYGFFLISFILIFLFISVILFICKYFQSLIIEINKIKYAKKNMNSSQKKVNQSKTQRKETVNKNMNMNINMNMNKMNYLSKISFKKVNRNNKLVKSKFKKIGKGKSLKLKAHFPPKKNILNIQKKTKTIKSNTNKKNNINNIISTKANEKLKKIMNYNDTELNSLNYKDSLKFDKRSYIKYYYSLLKKNQLILFAFVPNNDYNSQIIKIILFLFFFVLNLTVNALFFTDDTMHKIYMDSGSFNLNYQIPLTIYSSLISSIINIIIKFFALSEKQIISFKQMKCIKNIDYKAQELIVELKRKFILFFIIIFIFLSFFGFYISCFCGIYTNTQIHLIKDSVVGFCLSFGYPFLICLLPGVFRINALKAKNKDKEYLYKFSQLIQSL